MISGTAMALLLLVLLSLLPSPATADQLYYDCQNIMSRTGNLISNSAFNSNLNHLVSTLSSNASSTDYATHTTGIIPDKIYGFFLCRGDTNSDTCHSCISDAISEIQQSSAQTTGTLPYGTTTANSAIPTWTTSLFPTKQNIRFVALNSRNVWADRLLLFEILSTAQSALIGNLSNFAVTNTSQLFATGETAFTATDIIYGMVQCTRDLSVDDCQTCLQGTVEEITNGRLKGQMGGRVMGMWCSTRYEFKKFYNGPSMLQLSSNKPSSTRNGSTLNTTQGGIPLDSVLDTLRQKTLR